MISLSDKELKGVVGGADFKQVYDFVVNHARQTGNEYVLPVLYKSFIFTYDIKATLFDYIKVEESAIEKVSATRVNEEPVNLYKVYALLLDANGLLDPTNGGPLLFAYPTSPSFI